MGLHQIVELIKTANSVASDYCDFNLRAELFWLKFGFLEYFASSQLGKVRISKTFLLSKFYPDKILRDKIHSNFCQTTL